MGKKKLIRFRENLTFRNLFQPSYDELREGFSLRGKWKEGYFRNEGPLILELGCGKGEYTVGLARANPGSNFIGMDIKGARLWKGCRTALDEGLNNTAFIRSRAELVELVFALDEIEEIWLTFPDPHIRRSDEKKRLTSPEFLDRYSKIIKNGGAIHLKTDNSILAAYTLDVLESTPHEVVYHSEDVYHSGFEGPATQIRTFYEYKFLGQGIPIKYIQFRYIKR